MGRIIVHLAQGLRISNSNELISAIPAVQLRLPQRETGPHQLNLPKSCGFAGNVLELAERDW